LSSYSLSSSQENLADPQNVDDAVATAPPLDVDVEAGIAAGTSLENQNTNIVINQEKVPDHLKKNPPEPPKRSTSLATTQE